MIELPNFLPETDDCIRITFLEKLIYHILKEIVAHRKTAVDQEQEDRGTENAISFL